jgi:hypothetical protein
MRWRTAPGAAGWPAIGLATKRLAVARRPLAGPGGLDTLPRLFVDRAFSR